MQKVVVRFARLSCVLVLAALAPLINGCFLPNSNCKETVIQKSPSPDGRTTGVAILSDCGATTPYFTRVIMQTDRIPLLDKGEVFAIKGKSDLRLSWLGPQSLKIECAVNCDISRVYRQVVIDEDYKIEYVGHPSYRDKS